MSSLTNRLLAVGMFLRTLTLWHPFRLTFVQPYLCSSKSWSTSAFFHWMPFCRTHLWC